MPARSQPATAADPKPGAAASALAGLGLAQFSEGTASWFLAAFAEPTAVQAEAWRAIGNGDHALVVAPTGSGKTLAAFLWAIDKLATEPTPAEAAKRCRVLYVSPLKALAVDIERNLRSPLAGVSQAMRRLGLPEPDIRVGVRTGDTAADERRQQAGKPPDILITTPESLFLLLTSRAREGLRGIETVIIDEVHALAGGKRGAHLALSLERLDALRGVPGHRGLGGVPRLAECPHGQTLFHADSQSSMISPSRRLIVLRVAAAMSGLWVTMTIVAPWAFRLASSAMMSAPVAVSKLPVGSSAKMMAGPPISARAIATRWHSPPESCPGRCPARSARPTRSSASAA